MAPRTRLWVLLVAACGAACARVGYEPAEDESRGVSPARDGDGSAGGDAGLHDDDAPGGDAGLYDDDAPSGDAQSAAPAAPEVIRVSPSPSAARLVTFAVTCLPEHAELTVREDSVVPPAAGALWVPCAPTLEYVLVGGDGAHSLRVWARDAEGRVSDSPALNDVLLDTTPPVLLELTVASGAASTPTAHVAVVVRAADATAISGVLASDPDPAAWTWRPLAELVGLELPGANGTKSVYVRLRDAVGNATSVEARQIELAVTEPWGTAALSPRQQRIAAGASWGQLKLSLSAARDSDTHVWLEVRGDAAAGVDHDLADGVWVIPAGQLAASVSFSVLENGRPPGYVVMEVRIGATDAPRLRVSAAGASRVAFEGSAAPPGVARLASGMDAKHGCAISGDGVLRCWGLNHVGQVGDGTRLDRPHPVVVDPGVTYLDVGAGEDHTCGVTTAGALKCWGLNTGYRLGDGTTTSRELPTAIDTGVVYAQVAVGRYHACARTAAGQVKCWGGDTYAQLGNGAAGNEPTPRAIDTSVAYRDLRTLMHTTCAITTTDVLKCWGWNNYGQLGNGTTTDQPAPVVIDQDVSYRAISPGENHTCGLTTTGAARCWGLNVSGQLGDGSTQQRLAPVAADDGVTYEHLTARPTSTTCGVRSTGTLRCFGGGGLGEDASRRWSDIDGSQRHVCVRDDAGDVGCRLTGYGPATLGDGVLTYRRAPTVFDGRRAYQRLAMGATSDYGCALSAGVPYCWGAWTTRASQWGTGYTDFALGAGGACAIAAGTLSCSGYGALAPVTPHVVGGSTRYTAVTVGADYTCAITDAGALECMGTNDYGQLGTGGTTGEPALVEITPGERYRAVSAACRHTCAITTSGELRCWGDDTYGQLGQGTTGGQATSPLEVDAGVAYTAVATGCDAWSGHSCGVTSAGQLKCWGSNGVGQLGDGTTTGRPAPTSVDVGVAYREVSLSRFNNGGIASIGSCGITTAGQLRCWGGNGEGQVGDDTFVSRRAPVPVAGGNVTYTQVARGPRWACALTSAGLVACWGDNTSGALGDAPFPASGELVDVTPWLTQ